MTNPAAQAVTQDQQNQQDHADFLAEFGSEAAAPQPSAAAAKPEPEPKVTDGGSEGQAAGELAAAQAAPDSGATKTTEDPWKDVPPILKKTFDELNGKIGSIEHMTKSSAGRVGALQSALDEARKSATKQGAASPTPEQVQAAAEDSAEWESLRKEYPEWVSGFEKQMAIVEQRILKKLPAVDTGAISTDVLNKSSEIARNVGTEVKRVIPLYVKHPDWEDTIKLPEFHEWALTGGPTKEEYGKKLHLDDTDAQKSSEYTNELIRKYPQWWSEKGALLESKATSDAIKLMDSFSEHQKAAQAAEQDPPADQGRQGNKERLEKAIAPTKGAIKPKPAAKTEHDEFLEEFNNPN